MVVYICLHISGLSQRLSTFGFTAVVVFAPGIGAVVVYIRLHSDGWWLCLSTFGFAAVIFYTRHRRAFLMSWQCFGAMVDSSTWKNALSCFLHCSFSLWPDIGHCHFPFGLDVSPQCVGDAHALRIHVDCRSFAEGMAGGMSVCVSDLIHFSAKFCTFGLRIS